MEKFPNLIILQLEATLAPANKRAHERIEITKLWIDWTRAIQAG